jgi:hypothetical protein
MGAKPREAPRARVEAVRLKGVPPLVLVFESGEDEQWSTRSKVTAHLHARLRVVSGGRALELVLTGRIFEGAGSGLDSVYYATRTAAVYQAPAGYRIKAHAKGHLPMAPNNGSVYRKTNRQRVIIMGRGLIDRATASTKAYTDTRRVSFTGIRLREIAIELIPE